MTGTDASTCSETQTIGTPPLTVVLACRRTPKHTGKHVTPDGSAQWWGLTDRQMAACKDGAA